MNRLYTQFRYSLEKKIVDLYCKFAVGATGAPTIDADASKGVASVARDSAGKYTIVLQDRYVDLFLVQSMVETADTPTALGGWVLLSQAVAASGKSIVIQYVDEAGAAVELAEDSVVRLKFELKATSV